MLNIESPSNSHTLHFLDVTLGAQSRRTHFIFVIPNRVVSHLLVQHIPSLVITLRRLKNRMTLDLSFCLLRYSHLRRLRQDFLVFSPPQSEPRIAASTDRRLLKQS